MNRWFKVTKIRRRELGESSHKDDLAHRIKNDIKASPDLGLLRCVQCGMCASTCPASRHSNYDSRVVIKRVLDNGTVSTAITVKAYVLLETVYVK